MIIYLFHKLPAIIYTFHWLHEFTISANSAFRDAPPTFILLLLKITKKPSISDYLMRSPEFFPFTDPP